MGGWMQKDWKVPAHGSKACCQEVLGLAAHDQGVAVHIGFAQEMVANGAANAVEAGLLGQPLQDRVRTPVGGQGRQALFSGV